MHPLLHTWCIVSILSLRFIIGQLGVEKQPLHDAAVVKNRSLQAIINASKTRDGLWRKLNGNQPMKDVFNGFLGLARSSWNDLRWPRQFLIFNANRSSEILKEADIKNITDPRDRHVVDVLRNLTEMAYNLWNASDMLEEGLHGKYLEYSNLSDNFDLFLYGLRNSEIDLQSRVEDARESLNKLLEGIANYSQNDDENQTAALLEALKKAAEDATNVTDYAYKAKSVAEAGLRNFTKRITDPDLEDYLKKAPGVTASVEDAENKLHEVYGEAQQIIRRSPNLSSTQAPTITFPQSSGTITFPQSSGTTPSTETTTSGTMKLAYEYNWMLSACSFIALLRN